MDCLDRVDLDALDEVALDGSGLWLMANCASRIAIRLSWLSSFDVIGFILIFILIFCFSVSCSGVFHAMVDDLDVAPVRDEAGDDASSLPGIFAFEKFFDKILAMFFVNTVFGMLGWSQRLAV